MPRLGLAIDEDFTKRAASAPPDRFGRRVRRVEGVQIHEPKPESLFYSPFIVKLALWLSVIAVIGMSVALWRLFSFPH